MIERCTDFRRVRKFCDWDLSIGPECIYLADVHNEIDLGIWYFHPYVEGLMIHANLIARGSAAKQGAISALNWIFANTSFNVVYANIPEQRRDVRCLANGVGFRFVASGEGSRLYIFDRLQQMVA